MSQREPAVKHPAELSSVLTHLRGTARPGLELDRPPTILKGGFWAEMWLLTLAPGTHHDLPGRLVLRLAPDPQLATWETTFQEAIADQGYLTPRIRGFNFETQANQRAWCVMDFAEGTPMLAGLSGPKALLTLPRLARGLPDMLARAVADLHQLDPVPISTALRGVTNRPPGVDGLLEGLATRARNLGNARVQRSVERLAAGRPSSKRVVPCHGDIHPFNVLTTSTGYVVLDWTNGQIIHPAFDLAFTHLLVSTPPLAAPKHLRPLLNAAARRIADRFIKTYRSLSPHEVDTDAFDWFHKMHSCRILLDLAGWRAEGTLAEHPGHPWFLLEPKLLREMD